MRKLREPPRSSHCVMQLDLGRVSIPEGAARFGPRSVSANESFRLLHRRESALRFRALIVSQDGRVG